MRFPEGTIYGIVHAPHDEWLLTRLPSGIGGLMHLPAKGGKTVRMPDGETFRADLSSAEAFDGMPEVTSAEELLDWFWREGNARLQDPVLRDDVLSADPAWPEGEAACIAALSAALRAAGRGAGTLEVLAGTAAGAPARAWRLDGVDLAASDPALKAVFDGILARLGPTLEVPRLSAKAKGRRSGLGPLQRAELRLSLA
jgi:hypothetical protein